MDATTPKGYLDIVAKNHRPGTIRIQKIIENHLSQGIPPSEDGIIYISTNGKENDIQANHEVNYFPHEDIRKNLRKQYVNAGWKDLLFYKTGGDLFTIKLVLP